MENNNECDNSERGNSNTEYIPTKCRVTKPPPPKPATNPMQFVKVAPCPLFQKAHEQIKKVEEIKKDRKEVREEAEDWQQNLDNWKSCRRKRQEHIIDRVVEVKKMEQEGHGRHKRKSKTFNEMMEDRSKGRYKFNIPIFDDDSNDFSDYGIGSTSSKTNSIKDVDTDDSSSILYEKESSFESPCYKDNSNSSASNQSQSEDESNSRQDIDIKQSSNSNNNINYTKAEQYTYEGAIEDYRSRIRSKIHVDESIFSKKQDCSKSKEVAEAQSALPKGELFKRKELFEADKNVEITNYESPTSRRLSEDFVNSHSIKQRLQSLQKCTDQSNHTDNNPDVQTIKQRLQNDNSKPRPVTKLGNYFLAKSSNNPSFENNNKSKLEWTEKKNIAVVERCSSPETELYMHNLKLFSKDLDTLMYCKANNNLNNGLVDDYCVNPNYAPSTSSTELTGVSDREDSGIHTADVSCSVSQADEPVEDTELTAVTSCIENLATDENKNKFDRPDDSEFEIRAQAKQVVGCTIKLLEALQRDASENLEAQQPQIVADNIPKEPVTIYENVNIYDPQASEIPIVSSDDIVVDSSISFAPPTITAPPKVKPPPPPPIEEPSAADEEMRRVNSTKRIKKQIHIKRSSFLGLDEPTDDQIYPEIGIDKPPDINSFLQKESKLEKSLYKKTQEENRMGILSKVESHDSGLDIDRGRLSSDTWCSSIGDSNTPSPERQDSEPTNSITSEEDEITKKEREIIAMVEKEEKSRDISEYLTPNKSDNKKTVPRMNQNDVTNEPYLGSENFNTPYFANNNESTNFIEDQDSEVLKVEHELRQLEREELKRQRENLLFQESRAKARLQNNRHSLENIFDVDVYSPYRKSMPELQHVPLEYRKSLPDVKNAYNVYRTGTEHDVQYRKSMPDIQHYHKSVPDYHKPIPETVDHRKSMPEMQRAAGPNKRQPILPGKPLRPSRDPKDRFMMMNPSVSDAVQLNSKPRQLSRHSLQTLSALPKNRHLVDNWVQPRANPEKNYKQHWLVQEAELRRITEQQKNQAPNRSGLQPRQEKHLPDSVIQTLTQRAQNRAELNNQTIIRRPEFLPSKEPQQHCYLGHNQTTDHALPLPYQPPMTLEESQDRMLSVSGKKKCSNCSKELGRGAAMIIESLCLFYHMECFICCVCHMQLGDGRMGTDVRVRNQKLHCHNCYSSDDGIKFSCV